MLERRCIAAGYTPSLFSSHGEQELENNILDNLRSLKPAGVLLAPLGRTSDRKHIEAFCRDVPTILFDSNIEGLGRLLLAQTISALSCRPLNILAEQAMFPCFFEMKDPANPNANKRRLAYLDIMQRLNLPPHIVNIAGTGWSFEEIGRQGALEVLHEDALPTNTVLCSNDRLAIGFLSACHELGISVGREEGCAIRVASHDDHPYARFTCPSLTTAAHDYESVADCALATLFNLIEAGGKPFKARRNSLCGAPDYA